MADGLVVPTVLLGAWAMWARVPKETRWQIYQKAFFTGAVAYILAKIAGFIYRGERPFVASGQAPKASYLQNGGFPSDHVLFVFTITLIVWASTKNVKVSLALLAMSILVGVGRILALVHTPLDVAGGVFFAIVAALIFYGRDLFKADKQV